MNSLPRLLAALTVLLLTLGARATHNYAGEIIVCHLGGYSYEITIVTHTNPASPADRPEFVIDWGDNNIDTIPRIDEDVFQVSGIDVQWNLYEAQHTYGAPGTYLLQYIDPNRVAGIVNIPGSVNVPMCVQSLITVLPNAVGNVDCLPNFLNIPIQVACIFQPWIHNPGAFDPDGDSLSYAPAICLGPDDEDGDTYGDPIPGYLYPDEYLPGPNNQYSIDPVTGTITWDSPQQIGLYNIAFVVKEWRNGQLIGWVERDMLIIVRSPCDNEPPILGPMIDTCVLAGTNINFSVQATDPNSGQVLTLDAFGGPFEVAQNPATFVSNPSPNTVNGTFNWNTLCAHVRQQPWEVVFNVHDNYSTPLWDYATAYITVVAPAPENPSATPNGSIMHLQWDPDACTNAAGYRIYRRQELYGFSPDDCETGVPGYTGYQFIDHVEGYNNTSYDDQDLVFGITYCYMVTAYFNDGAESYASVEFCNLLERDVPILTNVSVGITSPSTGVDTVRWSNAWDLDTVQHPGPYRFRVYAGTGFTQANTLINTTDPYPWLQQLDTEYVHIDINTQTQPHVYRVELFGHGGDSLIGSSNVASSVFLELQPNDEQITLHMAHNTPWINDLFEVYRETSPNVFTLIGTSPTDTYVDSGLVNGALYCYKVQTIGAYSDTNIVAPLLNWSQIACARPVDLTPPCAPTLALDNDCETPLNTLTWNNPNNSCADDTYQYNIWFTDSLGGTPQLIASIIGAEITTYLHTDGFSVAGCYAVTAIDSVGNESVLSDTVCGDNCPIYTLPNVFSPNNDELNDFFVPFPYRGVKEIDLHIYNRWGQLVFQSKDPDIKWPGTLKQTTEPVSDGVYFYVCAVTLKRLAGDELLQLKGYVHILRGKQASLN